MSEADKPKRQTIIEAALRHTVGDRDLEYGPPAINLACAGELKVVFDRYNQDKGGPAFIEAMHMVLTKVGRVATAPGRPKDDTFEDGTAYFAIAGEVYVLSHIKMAPKQPFVGIAAGRYIECTCGAVNAKGWLHTKDCPCYSVNLPHNTLNDEHSN